MRSPVEFRIFVVYPPDREGRVCQLTVEHNGSMDIPTELYREDGQNMITLFSQQDGAAWTYPLADFITGINAAVAELDGPPPGARARSI